MNPETKYKFEHDFSKRINSDPQLSFLPKLFAEFPAIEWYLVGGTVRDLLMRRETGKDYDFVVRKMGWKDLQQALSKFGKVNLVGRNFGVLKFVPELFEDQEEIDIAFPRTEKAGMTGGYRDFETQANPELPIERDLARRDFTMNAIAWDVRMQRIIDPFEGRKDIDGKIVRAVGDPKERFSEDYSRMLRCLRFACQLGFDIEPETREAVKKIMPRINDARTVGAGVEKKAERVVPYETIAREFIKALAADAPRAIELYESSGALHRLIPELKPLAECDQPANYHSEGDVWTHTKLAISKLASSEFTAMFPDEKPTPETVLGVLFHDVAKPQTKAKDGDKITFYGHPEAGARVAQAAAERLTLSSHAQGGVDAKRLAWLVKMHLVPNLLVLDQVKRTTLSRHFLADPLAGRELLHVAFADASATIPEGGSADVSNLRKLLGLLREIESQRGMEKGRPSKLVSGEEIMDLTDLAPGPEVGVIIEELREAQLRGEVNTPEEAKAFIKSRHS